MGRGRQSINGGSQPSPGPPRSPAACSQWMASLVAHSNALMSEKRVEWRSQCTPLLRQVTAASNKASPVAMLSRVINSAEAEQELMLQSCHQQVAQMQPLQYRNHRATFPGNSILFPARTYRKMCRCHVALL